MVFGTRKLILLLTTSSGALSQVVPSPEQLVANITVRLPPTITLIISETQTSILEPSRLPMKLQSAIQDIQDYLSSEEIVAETEVEQAQLVNSEPILETAEDGNFTVVPPPRPASAPGREIVD